MAYTSGLTWLAWLQARLDSLVRLVGKLGTQDLTSKPAAHECQCIRGQCGAQLWVHFWALFTWGCLSIGRKEGEAEILSSFETSETCGQTALLKCIISKAAPNDRRAAGSTKWLWEPLGFDRALSFLCRSLQPSYRGCEAVTSSAIEKGM